MAQKPRSGVWLKNPCDPREHEEIGAGYFVFRRGDGTKRIRPSNWPFEHPTIEQALEQAANLAKSQPGQVFEVYKRVVATMSEGGEDGPMKGVELDA